MWHGCISKHHLFLFFLLQSEQIIQNFNLLLVIHLQAFQFWDCALLHKRESNSLSYINIGGTPLINLGPTLIINNIIKQIYPDFKFGKVLNVSYFLKISSAIKASFDGKKLSSSPFMKVDNHIFFSFILFYLEIIVLRVIYIEWSFFI